MSLPNLFNTENYTLFSQREGFSYERYLEDGSHFATVRAEIACSTRQLIAHESELAAQGVRVAQGIANDQAQQRAVETRATQEALGAVGGAIEGGFDRLEYSLQDLTNALTRSQEDLRRHVSSLERTFDFRLREVVAGLGSLDDKLADLLQTAKTPSQTWALEQFELARDAVSRSLYAEALEALDRAINGFQGQVGHKLEHRFHLLEGVIRLGNSDARSREFVDLEKSYQALLNAEKYAQGVNARDQSHALALAGYNRLCVGDARAALGHLDAATSRNPHNALAYFYLAKAHAALGEAEAALRMLTAAIALDPAMALKAAGDSAEAGNEAWRGLYEAAVARAHETLSRLCAEWAANCSEQNAVLRGVFAPAGGVEFEALAKPEGATLNAMHRFIVEDGHRPAILALIAKAEAALVRHTEESAAQGKRRESAAQAAAAEEIAGLEKRVSDHRVTVLLRDESKYRPLYSPERNSRRFYGVWGGVIGLGVYAYQVFTAFQSSAFGGIVALFLLAIPAFIIGLVAAFVMWLILYLFDQIRKADDDQKEARARRDNADQAETRIEQLARDKQALADRHAQEAERRAQAVQEEARRLADARAQVRAIVEGPLGLTQSLSYRWLGAALG